MAQPSAIFLKLFYFSNSVISIEFILQMENRLFYQVIVRMN